MNPAAESQRRSKGMPSDRLVAQRGRLFIGEALRIVRHVCDDLKHLHALEHTHAGVDPRNIIITFEGAAELQVVTSASSDGVVELDQTQDDRKEASGLHIVPEAVLGQPVDPRADIYGLGAAFYFLLTGRRIFEPAETAEARMQHLADTAPAVTDLVPGVPASYARIIAKMLAKPPEDRYQSIASLEADLDAAVGGRPTLADRFHGVSSCALPGGSSLLSHAADEDVAELSREVPEVPADRASAPDTADLSNFEWSDRLCLGVPELDAQHKWWFKITRNFIQKIRDGQLDEPTICVLLEQLMRYASNHFTSEEKFMATICYSPFALEEHLASHREFEERLEVITDDLLTGKPGVDRELEDFLVKWLSRHILEVDVKYIRFYRERQKERRKIGSRRLWAV